MKSLILVPLVFLITLSGLKGETYTEDIKEPVPVGGMRSLERHLYYPSHAYDQHLEGRVVLEFRIGTDGRASHVRILESAGYEFDRVAVRAIEQTRWVPAQLSGRDIVVTYRLPFDFTFPDS